jgi:hypothetical protein
MTRSQIVPGDGDMLPEYDFIGGVRGKYVRDFGRSPNIRILGPDLLETFPDSASVNEALQTMKKTNTVDDDPLETERNFSDGRPNPYWLGLVDRSCVRLLDKDVAEVFTDSRAVNEALRTLIRIGDSAVPRKKISAKPASPRPTRKKARS